MDQANDGFNRGRLDLVGVSSFFVFVLRVGEGGVHAGTLAEGVAVANSAGEALQRSIGVIDGVSIEVAGVGRSGTAHDRNANTEAKTPALGTQGAELITLANHSLLGRIINGHVVGRYRFGIVEILAAEVNLRNLEVIVTTDRDGESIVHVLRDRVVTDSSVVNAVHNANESEAAGNKLGTDTVVTVRRRLVFNADLVCAVRVHGVLRINRQTGKARSHVGNRVVKTGKAVGTNELKTAGGITVTRGERARHAEQAVGAVGAGKLADAAEGNAAEAAVDEELSFTVEETFTVAESTGIGGETVFKDETNLNTVAKVFRTLQAEAGPLLAPDFMSTLLVLSTPAVSASRF